jgi:N4-gp56 family major capsid protein
MAGQVWSVAAEGGFMYSDELSNKLRMAMQPLNRFRQFCDAEDGTEKGLHAGDKFNWNVYSDVATQGTDLTEGIAMPETGYTITQGQLTVVEKGNSVPYTSRLDDLSLHPVSVVIDKVLKNDANKALDIAAHAQFNATLLQASHDGTTLTIDTDGTPTSTNNQALDAATIKSLIDTMKERNIPMYDGDDYYCVGHPTTFRPVKNDLETIHQHTETGFGLIMKGEEGRYENTRFIHQNLIAKEAGGWNTNSLSNWAFFFGEDNVTEGIVIPEEMRGKIPDDFGRSKGIAWYYLGGFGIVHNSTGALENRILKWATL